jgi:hypothetical protein
MIYLMSIYFILLLFLNYEKIKLINFFIKFIKIIFHLKMEFNHLLISSFIFFILINSVSSKIFIRMPEKLASLFSSKKII